MTVSCDMEIEKACEAAKAHQLLTARILRFCEAAKDQLGLDTQVDFSHSEIHLSLDRKSNLKRGIWIYSICIEPGALRTAIRLNKLRAPSGKASGAFVFHFYDSVKTWPHPTDEAFAELLEKITTEVQSKKLKHA
jgi:hypothetical protein